MKMKNQPKNIQVSLFNHRWTLFFTFVLLLFIAILYYYPSLNDKSIPAHDYQQGRYFTHQVVQERVNTGESPNWAPNLFSGMPSFQITKQYNNIGTWVREGLLKFAYPYLFIGILVVVSATVLFSVMGLHPIIVFIGSIALLLSNFTIISLMAGHNNKVMVMSLVPLTLAGIWALYEKKKYLLGLFLVAISIALQIRYNHVQITYFMMFLVGFWTIFNIAKWVKEKEFKHLIMSLALIAVGIGIGAASNATHLIATQEYSRETQRGGPSEVELAKNTQEIKSEGLDYDYATSWSYGIAETFTLLIPNFSGGPEAIKKVKENNKIVSVLTSQGVPANNAMQLAQQLPTYWGNQPFVAGTTYISAILIFLTFLGFVLLKDYRKWWLLSAFIITLFVAWGNNFSAFYKFLFNYLPLFNKFRTPSMIFYLTTIITAITSGLLLQYFINEASQREVLWKQFLKVAGSFIGFMVLMTLVGPALFSFTNSSDQQLQTQLLQITQNNQQMADTIFSGLLLERKAMMRADALRSTILIVLTFIAIAAYLKRKLTAELMLTAIAVLLLIDIIGVDRRYVTHDSFQSNSVNGINGPQLTAADLFILQDKDPDYRVLDLTVNTFNDAKPSYFHKNIGGYHSAKLKRYQDIISFQFNDNLKKLSEGTPQEAQVLNMLNTRYIITKPEEDGVFTNEFAYGPAWLVNEVKVLDGSVAVFDDLMNEDLSHTALLEKPSTSISSNQSFELDSNASIKLEQYSNDRLVYSFSSEHSAYAVFSEVYYNDGKGWSAYIDGEKVHHDQVNYVLRGLSIPAGTHEIVFEFDSPKLKTTEKIDFASSILIVLLGLAALGTYIIEKRKKRAIA